MAYIKRKFSFAYRLPEMGKYKRLPENYFKLTNPVVISFVCVGMYLLLVRIIIVLLPSL